MDGTWGRRHPPSSRPLERRITGRGTLARDRTCGIRRTALRASSQEALERRVEALERAGLGIGRRDGDPGLGPTYPLTRLVLAPDWRTVTWTPHGTPPVGPG
ncbi:hypothetical protein [Streptomyces montanisoli]|uniref:Uncharacterized protein n=1 Tax=Streptomyces montanisoli TaxID=2798581 RepID=A0A940MF74_9ACTN|nr:hypothetical protein [Streptomyces montanisoli]MBP0457548.1 hypothetical protein [Streptomyces montanisoli]